VCFVFVTEAVWFEWLIAKEVSAMRKMLVVAGLLALWPCAAIAQDTPKVEVYGGYSYLRANPQSGFVGSNASGWNASAAWNWNKRLGLRADVSGHYCCTNQGQRTHDFLFGPQLNFRRKSANIFFHGLMGISHGNAPAASFSDTVLAWAGGGGVDIHWTERVSVRIAQVDYFGTHYAGVMQHHFRYSIGVVYKFGGK
jgi:opacity protein-like surface antigen